MNALLITTSFLALAVIVAIIAGMWMVFKKAGESGWKALIPFYNYYIMFRLSGHSGWWTLIFFLPVVPSLVSAVTSIASAQTTPAGLEAALNNSAAGATLGALAIASFILTFLIFNIIILVQGVLLYDIARSFGKGLGFTIGLATLPFVFWPILGFGGAKYRGPVAHPKMVAAGTGAHIDPTKVSDGDESGEADKTIEDGGKSDKRKK